jgi:hypothetical protein
MSETDSPIYADEGSGQPSIRKSGGPKTQQGKEKSKHNALKHGIFSQVVLLPWEPRAELDSLLSGLRDHFEPEGTPEELLVDKLAALVWRQRRLIISEGAEIRKGTEFLEHHEKQHQDEEAAINRLEKIKTCIERDNFNKQNDKVIKTILVRLYGNSGVDTGAKKTTLLDIYSRCLDTALSNASAGENSESPSPEECVATFLSSLNREIKRLKSYKREPALIESLRGNVTYAPQLDRLLRYESSLERAFDRTLNQLERLKRIRKGQPVPPTLNVKVSS